MTACMTRPRNSPRARNKVGRNDHCPCGSGKKYKKCCGPRNAHAVTTDPAPNSKALYTWTRQWEIDQVQRWLDYVAQHPEDRENYGHAILEYANKHRIPLSQKHEAMLASQKRRSLNCMATIAAALGAGWGR